MQRTDGQLLALGAIWETWHDGQQHALTSAAIITTPARTALNWLHDRMPLVIEPKDWDACLSGDEPAALLQSVADDVLSWHQVYRAVGDSRIDNPRLIALMSSAA